VRININDLFSANCYQTNAHNTHLDTLFSANWCHWFFPGSLLGNSYKRFVQAVKQTHIPRPTFWSSYILISLRWYPLYQMHFSFYNKLNPNLHFVYFWVRCIFFSNYIFFFFIVMSPILIFSFFFLLLLM